MRDQKVFKDREVVFEKCEEVVFSIFYWEDGRFLKEMPEIIFLDVLDIVHISEI